MTHQCRQKESWLIKYFLPTRGVGKPHRKRYRRHLGIARLGGGLNPCPDGLGHFFPRWSAPECPFECGGAITKGVMPKRLRYLFRCGFPYTGVRITVLGNIFFLCFSLRLSGNNRSRVISIAKFVPVVSNFGYEILTIFGWRLERPNLWS